MAEPIGARRLARSCDSVDTRGTLRCAPRSKASRISLRAGLVRFAVEAERRRLHRR